MFYLSGVEGISLHEIWFINIQVETVEGYHLKSMKQNLKIALTLTTMQYKSNLHVEIRIVN
jgi:hypothetical protein